MILLIMALILAAMLAAWTLSRVTGSGSEREDTLKRLAAAAASLEQFAAANGRLPCPANPALNTGASDPTGASKSCAHAADGTLPWATLGLISDAGLDGWGRKITYRVYTGAAGGGPGANKGSLTQARGVNMVECDITDDVKTTDDDGLCFSGTPHNRRTVPGVFGDADGASFFGGKGLKVHDYGDIKNDSAYVLISHGQSGRGAWTVAGTQVPFDGSAHEQSNTTEKGDFWIEALSDPDQGISSGSHFDDLLVYARLPDLVKRIGLVEREWPEVDPASIGSTAVSLTQANVEAASGTTVNPTTGDTGTSSVNFGTARVSGFTGADTATDISYDPNTSGSGTGGIGVVSGGSPLLSSANGELIRVDFTSFARRFSITLDHFGIYSSGATTYTENVELRFFDDRTLVMTVPLAGCRADGGLASFSDIDPGGLFNSVDIVPVSATGTPSGTSNSSFLVAQIQACDTTSGNCRTSLWSGTNKCD